MFFFFKKKSLILTVFVKEYVNNSLSRLAGLTISLYICAYNDNKDFLTFWFLKRGAKLGNFAQVLMKG